ncbi:MAG: hypothetical protein FWD48_01720 [Oscillospiraceae bacterium]|nr:hypothetical protein [Oscillospiraceae bacterium]
MKISKYKIIFYLSLTPYAAILLLSVIVAYTGYGFFDGYKGFDATNYWLKDTLLSYGFLNNFRRFLLFVCITYQIIYSLKLKNINKESYESTENNSVPKKRGKAAKVFFWLSFSPYVYVIVTSFNSAKNGFSFFFSTTYGIDAFLSTMFFSLLYLCIIPVIPASIVYQITYKVTKNEIKLYKQVETKPARSKIKTILNIIILTPLLTLAVILCINLFNNEYLEYLRKINQLNYYINNSDITYTDTDGRIRSEGIMGTSFTQRTMFIDFETETIAFLSDDFIVGFRVSEFREGDPVTYETARVKYQEELESPGKMFTAYYYLVYPQRMTGVTYELIMENGAVIRWDIDDLKWGTEI